MVAPALLDALDATASAPRPAPFGVSAFSARPWPPMLRGPMGLALFSPVRVVRLRRAADDSYDDWGANVRRPIAGDIGVVIDVLHADGFDDRYVVECVGEDGATLWICDLAPDELQPV